MALVDFADDEMRSDDRYPVETQLALIRRDLASVHEAIYGNGRDKKGLVSKVDDLMMISDRGRTGLRVALWLGGATVAAITAVAQFKAALLSLFGLGPPPGH